MIIYSDTSVILGVYLKQAGYQQYRKALREADDVISCPLFVSEIAAVFKREDIDLAFLKPCVESVSIFYPSNDLIDFSKQILSNGYCRGADLYHLSCALSLDPNAKRIVFATYDKQQKKLAAAIGMQVL